MVQESGGRSNVRPLVETNSFAMFVVRSPGRVADDVALIVEYGRRCVEYNPAGRQRPRRGPQPVVSRFVVVLIQVDDELASIGRLKRAVDDTLDVLEVVAGQPGDQVNRKLRMLEGRILLSEKRIPNHARGFEFRPAHFRIE